MKFTLAERQVLQEQVESAMVGLRKMDKGLRTQDNRAIHTGWEDVGEAMTYLGSVLQVKGAKAYADMMRESMGGESDG